MMKKKGVGDELREMWQSRGLLVRLLLINCGVFVVVALLRVFLTLGGGADWHGWLIASLALPAALDAFMLQPWSLLSYAFLHEGLFHLLFNMLVLYWFGRLLVEYMGARHLRALYILGAMAAGAFYMLIYNLVPYYASLTDRAILLGASGAVYAVVVAAATLLPDYSFYMLFIGPVRIKYIAWLYVFLSFIGIVGVNSGGALAHLGGAFLGWLYVVQRRRGIELAAPIDAIFELFSPSQKRKQRPKRKTQTRNKKTDAKGSAESTDLDAILDKISASGYDNLSREEKERLFRLSKKK